MKRFPGVLALAGALLLSTASIAEDAKPPIPPDNAMKLSELIAAVETRSDFRYVSEVLWNDDGYYEVTYYTSDKAKVEITYDPVTGESK